MSLAGETRDPEGKGVEGLTGTANYFSGKRPEGWHRKIPTYSRIQYSNVYPGIDIAYYSSGQELEFDFIVAAGADPETIRLSFQGTDGIGRDSHGNLILQVRGKQVLLSKPKLYQTIDGKKREVPGGFVITLLRRRTKYASWSVIMIEARPSL
ncbi:hypothetical protein HY346_00625 [Candidatus Microgenomates bacterium]|nr:hypothetical protein [Candidatus Microgenomates bacterium]